MSRCMLGLILVMMTVAAHADENNNTLRFQSVATLSSFMQGDTSQHSSAYYTPDGGYAAANSFQVEVQHEHQVAAVREQIYQALGIADYIPRGTFMTGGLQTSWHLTASLLSTQRSLAFSIDTRW